MCVICKYVIICAFFYIYCIYIYNVHIQTQQYISPRCHLQKSKAQGEPHMHIIFSSSRTKLLTLFGQTFLAGVCWVDLSL